MQTIRHVAFGLLLGSTILFVSYLVGTANNVTLNQAAIASVHNMVRVA